MILPLVFYEYETVSVTLREERRLRVFKDRVLRKVCGPRSGKVSRWWRRPHNEALYDLYSSPNIIWVIKSRRGWAEDVALDTGLY
jgi:hypothetical protein